MKKILSLVLTVVLALSCAILPALADSHPLMYKVTDKDGHTIYLLGTLHMMSQETLPIANLDEMLGNVDRVIFEVSEADMEKAASDSVTISDLGSGLSSMMQMFTLDNGLSQETLELVAGFLSGAYNETIDAESLRMMSAPMLAQLLNAQFMTIAGYDASGHGVDLEVFRKAKAFGKKIEGVETLEEQMEAISAENTDTALLEKQILELMNHPEQFKEQVDSLIHAYNTGDKGTLQTIFTSEGARSLADAGRNARFLEVAKKALTDGGRVLIAIGTYHIIAEDGLVNVLTREGYTVEAL